MKRLLSILLLAAFALPLVAPLFAFAQEPDSGLPVCCRRHGQHHCAMLQRQKDPSRRQVGSVCPAWPQQAVPAFLAFHPWIPRLSPFGVSLNELLIPTASRDAHLLQMSERLHPKRGPPFESSALA